MARGKVCPGHGPGQTALAGLGFGDLQRSRPLEQVGISYFLSKEMPTCVAFLPWARFFCLLDLLHCFQTQEHCVFYALSILDIALEDPLDFQAIIMVCFFLSFSKIPRFSSLQVRRSVVSDALGEAGTWWPFIHLG